MEKYYPVIEKAPLFRDVAPEDIPSLIKCLAPAAKKFLKQEMVVSAGQPASKIGLMLSGSAQVVDEDVYGNRSILTDLGPHDLFGEAFCFAGTGTFPVSVVAVSDCEAMFFDCRKIISPCASACVFHKRLVENMMQIIAVKNVMLSRKIEHISKRRTRDKLISYLSSEAKKAGSMKFKIPYDRQELADFLCVDRSALSGELGKMKKEGLLDYSRSEFEIRLPPDK